jgi:trimethylamine--corrinoid protein Co-methyltransferase
VYENWISDGKKTLTQRAHDKLLDILELYEPEPLSKDIQQKLRAIVERAEAKILKK